MEKIKILLIDDDIRLGSQIALQLNERDNYEVTYSSSAQGVSETIAKMQPDILVFDVEIGNENGIEVAIQLYNGYPDIPIIFISSNHAAEMRDRGMLQAGAVNYLEKPFATSTLATYIDRFVREKNTLNINNDHIKQFGNVQFGTRNRALIYENEKIVGLRLMELALFKIFTDNFGQIVSREALMNAAWEGLEKYYNEQSLNNYIRRLRVMLEKNSNLSIEMARKSGYKMIIRQVDC